MRVLEGPVDDGGVGTLLPFWLVHNTAFLRDVFLHTKCPDSSLKAVSTSLCGRVTGRSTERALGSGGQSHARFTT